MSRFDLAVLDTDPDRRRVVLDLLDAALDAADPYRATTQALSRDGSLLRAGTATVDLAATGAVVVLGLGKAAAGMATAVMDAIDGGATGVVATNRHADLPRGLELVVCGHPVPDEASLDAGRRLLAAAADAGEADLVIVAISGGGSAMAENPVDGIDLDEFASVTKLLLGAAVPIDQVNAVRTRLSRFKGGHLAAAASDAQLITLVLSDVPGDPLHVVASGPTFVPPQGDHIAADVVELLPRHIRTAVDAYLPPPHHGRHTWALVADGRSAATAVVDAATGAGFDAIVAADVLTGEARQAGRRVVADAPPGLAVHAGETVVEVTGAGIGGRNQELALAAALAIEDRDDIVIAALATDGIDGVSAAAGAIVDGGTAQRARAGGVDPATALAANDSTAALAAAGDLLVSGPTGTNVADIVVTWCI